MDRRKQIALAALAAVVVFLAGFLPQWSRARALDASLHEAQHELRMARLEGRLGAALSESLRSNYERSRTLMTGFFTDLQGSIGDEPDADRRRTLEGILGQRDEIITLLSRAQPESTQRLMILYTTYFAAMDPAGRAYPAPPPPGPSAPPIADTPARRDSAAR